MRNAELAGVAGFERRFGAELLRARDGSRSGGGGGVDLGLPPVSRQIKADPGSSRRIKAGKG